LKTLASIIGIYGLITIAGGLIGFFIAGSTASIVMGSLFGFLLVISALAIMKEIVFGLYAASLLTLILTGFFIYRYIATAKWMPSGLMMIISLVVFIITVLTYIVKSPKT
jgi:uncharacterized membrane protein (UPF0136 family)